MKKKNYYLRALIIYCLVLAIILGAALFVLNRFLVSYEASRPDNTVEEYMASHGREHWLGGLQDLISRGFSEFTLATAGPDQFGIDENGEITWRSAGGDESSKSYDVRLGRSKICTLTLSPAEDVGFGMTNWTVTGEEFQIPGGSDITISVPTGCTATINGVEVGSSYISGVGNLGVDMDHSFDIAPASEVYLIPDMMGPAEIKAFDSDGNELEAHSVSSTEVEFFPVPVESFCFYTLPDAKVTVNGVDISGSCCESLEGELGAEILRYKCSGLYTQPEISVSVDGNSSAPAHLSIGSFFIPGAGEEPSEEIAEFLEGFIYAYVDFSANKNRSADANFAALAKYLMPGSELYTLTANTIENIAWATTSGLEYHSIDYYDLIPLGGDRYICNIYYDISYTLAVNDLDVKSGNTILFEKYEGSYRVSAMGAELKG